MLKTSIFIIPFMLIAIANAQSVIGTTTIPITSGLSPSAIPNAPSTISSITTSNIPTQPLLIIYYNNANNGYYAYVLSNQTDASFFLNTPNVYENILPNATYYDQIPSLTNTTNNAIISDLQAKGLNSTQIAQNMGAISNQLNNETSAYAYTGSIFYSGYATSSPLVLECHFINSADCNEPPNGILTIADFTDFISQTNTPYNASIIFYDTNSSFSTNFISGIETTLNGGVSACLNYYTLAMIVSGGSGGGCAIASGTFSIINAIDSYFVNGNLNGKPITIPQIPIPLYAETQISTPNTVTLIGSYYNPSQTINIQFNYDNNMLPNTNMENSIFAFNIYADGNSANQMINQFFNTSLLEIFVIAIVCYIVLKFNGA